MALMPVDTSWSVDTDTKGIAAAATTQAIKKPAAAAFGEGCCALHHAGIHPRG